MLGWVFAIVVVGLFIIVPMAWKLDDTREDLRQYRALAECLADDSWNQWFVHAMTTHIIDYRHEEWRAKYGSVHISNRELIPFVQACREFEAAQALHTEIKQITS